MDTSAQPAVDVHSRAVLQSPSRLAAVRATGLLDAPPEPALDRLAALAARLCAAPCAGVALVDAHRLFYAALAGRPPEPIASTRALPIQDSVCQFTLAAGGPVAIADVHADPRTRTLDAAAGLGLRAYAGVPIFLHDELIGTLCVMDGDVHEWAPDQIDVLADLGASVSSEIARRVLVAERAGHSQALRAAIAAADAERRRLEAVLDALPVGVIIADASGRVTHANRQVAEVCGGTPDAAATANTVYRGWWAESGRPVVPGEWPLARALNAGERVVDEVIDIARLDGRLGTILNSAAPVRDAAGAITGGVATVLDVTRRARSERAIRQLAAAALAVSRRDTVPEVLREVTEHARGIIGAHRGCTALTANGDHDAPLTVLSLSERHAERDRDGRPDTADQPLATRHATFAASLRGPVRGTGYGAPARQAGSWLVAPLVGGDGRNIGFIELADRYEGDFTPSDEWILVQLAQMASAAVEKAQADALVRENAEHTRRLLSVTAALGETVTLAQIGAVVTSAVQNATGAAASSLWMRGPDSRGEAELLSARGYPEALLDEWRSAAAEVPAPAARVLASGEPLWLPDTAPAAGGDAPPGPGDDAPRIAANAALPLLVQGRALGALVLGFADDRPFTPVERAVLTAVARQCAQAVERARLYDAERRARATAERANRAKSDFLATMSHELRTPLNAIGGYVDLMAMGLRGPVTDAQQRDMDRIKRAQQHLLGLINDVLNFAKLDAGRVRYAIDDVAIAAPMASVEAMIAPQLRMKGIGYVAGPCPPHVVVRADAEKVRQILLNLLTNALKFTEVGGTIAVRCEADAAVARVRVSDTGVGISPDKLPTIFDPFVQVDRGLSRPTEGIGLGLSISRDLARGMGGELTVASEVGRGSVFTLALPLGASAPL